MFLLNDKFNIFEKELLTQKSNSHRMLLRSLVNEEDGNTAVEPEQTTNVFDNIEVKFPASNNIVHFDRASCFPGLSENPQPYN